RAVGARTGGPLDVDALAYAAEALAAGRIGALKGLGGYHLACDAGDESACRTLRARKERDDKPFAVLVADIESAVRLAHVSERERDLLLSPARPIVLLRRRRDETAGAAVAPSVAPESALL